MKYDEVLDLLKSNSDLNIVRRMQMIGLDPTTAFAGGDWRNCDFSHLDLRKFDMRNGDFRGAIFINADVRNADFRGSMVDKGLSIAQNFDSAVLDYLSKQTIEKSRDRLLNPLGNVYEKENFLDQTQFDSIVKDAIISFENFRNIPFEKFNIIYEKINMTNYILLKIFSFINENYKIKNSQIYTVQFIKLLRKHKGSHATFSSIPMIEASKYIKYDDFKNHIWPILRSSTKFSKFLYRKYHHVGNDSDEKIRFAFEICKSKHQKKYNYKQDDIVGKNF